MAKNAPPTSTRTDQLRPELELTRTIGYLSARVGQAFQRSLLIKLREAGFSITVEEWRLMRALWAEDGLPQARLGDIALKDKGQLSSPQDAAARVLAYLARADFGANPVADVRD